MTEIEDLASAARDFAGTRDWLTFHTPKNLAMAIAGESGELIAEFQWLTAEQSQTLDEERLTAVRLEMADIFIYLVRLADVLGVDLVKAAQEKLALNETRVIRGPEFVSAPRPSGP